MRLLYNPKHVGDRKQAWRCFLIGSMIASSFIFLALTENVAVFFTALVMIAVGVVLFIYTNISFGKAIFLSQNILSAGAGLVISLIFHLAGFLLLYLGMIVILIFITWFQKFTIPRKSGPAEKPEKPAS